MARQGNEESSVLSDNSPKKSLAKKTTKKAGGLDMEQHRNDLTQFL
jgi:hypothetical protein